MDNTDGELWDLSPINGASPGQDFNWPRESTDLGPLQDCNPQHETPELLPHPGPSKRGRKPKLTDSERMERRKMSNKKYRLKMKDVVKNAIEAEDIVKQAGILRSENERQLKYIKQLEKEINKLKSQRHVLKTNVQGQSEHVEQMIMGWLVCQPCNATLPAAAAEFFRKLEQDEESNVDFKDFTNLHEKQEYRTVGKYQIPLSLVPTAEKITEVYGDVCATSTISRIIAGKIYILFCATIKEMSELPLEKVTEKTMLKWRDAIKDALCIKFKVEFAMEHLKKTIAPRYFGMKAYEEVEKIDVDIAKLEACLNGLNECKKFIDIAKEFDDKPFSEGLWG